MCGSPVTSGLSLNRSSAAASWTSISPVPRIVRSQKAMSRGVSATSSPMRHLNHCRFSSTSDTSAIGVPQIAAASSAISSKPDSESLSSTSYRCSAARRCCSSGNPAALPRRSSNRGCCGILGLRLRAGGSPDRSIQKRKLCHRLRRKQPVRCGQFLRACRGKFLPVGPVHAAPSRASSRRRLRSSRALAACSNSRFWA